MPSLPRLRVPVRSLLCIAAAALAGCIAPHDDQAIEARFAALGLRTPLPPYGTEVPLDSIRLAAVLSDSVPTDAEASGQRAAEYATSADAARLAWLWQVVGKVDTSAADAWIEDAAGAIATTARDYREWPIKGVTGPAAEAAILERVTDAELAVIAARLDEVRTWFAALEPSEDSGSWQTLRDSDPEALGWLAQQGRTVMLAGNRFESADDAAEFVRALYASGAVRVVVTTESIRQVGPKEWYADALRVVLPADPAQRATLFSVINEEAVRQGFDHERDTGQTVLFLWWD